jgi:hypothetical protein
MAAFLYLAAGSDLTLADVAAFVDRARALGATDATPVQLGEPPAAINRAGTSALTVPVTVTKSVLPPA